MRTLKSRTVPALLGLALLASLPAWAGVAEGERAKPIQAGGEKPETVQVQLPEKAAAAAAAPAAAEAPEPAPAPVPRAPVGDEDAPTAIYQQWKALEPHQLIPDKSVFYAATSNYSATKDAFFRSALQGLIAEPEVLEPLLDTWDRMRKGYLHGDGTLSPLQQRRRELEVGLFDEMVKHIDLHAAFALDFVQVQKAGAAAPREAPRFLFVISLPKTERGELRQQELADLMDRFSASQLIDRHYKDNVSNVGAYRIQELKCEELDLEESWAFVENLFLYGRGPGIVEEALKVYQVNKGAGSLQQNPGYASSFGKVGEDANLYLQLDVMNYVKAALNNNPLVARVLGLESEEAQKIRPQLAIGLKVMDGDKAAIKEKWLWRLSQGEQSLGPCKAVSAYLASNNSLFFEAHQFNLADSIKKAASLGGEGEGGPAMLRTLLAGLQSSLGANDQGEVIRRLEPFKGEMAFNFSYIAGGDDLLEMFQPVLALEFNRADLAEVTTTLDKLSAATNLTYQKQQFHGAELYYQLGAIPGADNQGQQAKPLLDVLLGGSGRKDEEKAKGAPFFAGYAIVDVSPQVAGAQTRWFVLFSDSVKALKKAISQSRVQRHSLAQREEFKQLGDNFDEQRSTVAFLDLPRMTEALYRQILPQLARGSTNRAGVLEFLPPENIVVPHLSAMGWAVTMHTEGRMIEVISPTGNLSLLGLVSAFALPKIQAERQLEVSRRIDENIRRISLGLHLYAADFDRFPSRLSDLVPGYVRVEDLAVFESPFKKGAVKRAEDVDDIEKTNLVYLPGRSLQDMSDQIMLFEIRPTGIFAQQEVYRTVHHVLYLDGRVTMVPASNLRQKLKGVRGLPKGIELQQGASVILGDNALSPSSRGGMTASSPAGAAGAAGEGREDPLSGYNFGIGGRPSKK
ncbi:MAG: DUF3352 domain-containing protein [Planctomycetota bacterium]|nr:DUF3352 domain-containing protein [Planctomycetota bacterium]